jgi:hypothetical protein
MIESNLMDSEYDDSDLCRRADDKIRNIPDG